MELLDGKKLSLEIKQELKREVDKFLKQNIRAPHLVAILVGNDPASEYYVKSKMKSCTEVGFKSTNLKLSAEISEEELLNQIDNLNNDDSVDGFIVQLPLPGHINVDRVLSQVNPDKDVDGFHPLNLGKLILGLDTFIPATPLGILEMIRRYEIPTEGKDIVILGRSNIVGKPLAIALSQKKYPGNATVTLAHSRTKNLTQKLKEADIIVAAIGIPHFVKAEMVKKGAVVIDVGINRIVDKSCKSGYRIVGDVDFDYVATKTSFITPVPGGVGLMTVTSLLLNTFKSYKKRYEL